MCVYCWHNLVRAPSATQSHIHIQPPPARTPQCIVATWGVEPSPCTMRATPLSRWSHTCGYGCPCVGLGRATRVGYPCYRTTTTDNPRPYMRCARSPHIVTHMGVMVACVRACTYPPPPTLTPPPTPHTPLWIVALRHAREPYTNDSCIQCTRFGPHIGWWVPDRTIAKHIATLTVQRGGGTQGRGATQRTLMGALSATRSVLAINTLYRNP